jgi:hypothetical protein
MTGAYQPQRPVLQWLEKRLPIGQLIYSEFVAYPTPRNLSYWWTFGAILSLMLGVQIVTGIVLAMHYTPHVDLAFKSIEIIMRDVNYGWLLRYLHANGAAMFFLAVYMHMFRSLYYGSYKEAVRVGMDLGRHHLSADGGRGLHGVRAGVGPDELLGRDRHNKSVFGHSRRRRHHRHLAVGWLCRSEIRPSIASIRCTTYYRF